MVNRFVVHEHDATRLHYDFRLEMEGVLRSWTIPKGPSMDPSEKRLAILVEDHPLEYFDFEGIIPEGTYGAGPVVVWDSGTFDFIEKNENMISFFLKGKILIGTYRLVRLRGKGKENQWLLIKGKDQYAKSGWKLQTSLTKNKISKLEVRKPPCETY
ncbi:MAG TPA: DNA polymerase ligase N-terminal domain-containing protein [Thermodesulfobacteriota bacterium]